MGYILNNSNHENCFLESLKRNDDRKNYFFTAEAFMRHHEPCPYNNITSGRPLCARSDMNALSIDELMDLMKCAGLLNALKRDTHRRVQRRHQLGKLLARACPSICTSDRAAGQGHELFNGLQ
jgi:hypothetical protein